MKKRSLLPALPETKLVFQFDGSLGGKAERCNFLSGLKGPFHLPLSIKHRQPLGSNKDEGLVSPIGVARDMSLKETSWQFRKSKARKTESEVSGNTSSEKIPHKTSLLCLFGTSSAHIKWPTEI